MADAGDSGNVRTPCRTLCVWDSVHHRYRLGQRPHTVACSGVFQRDAPFEGKAQEFLDNLTRVIVPAIDKAMNLTPEFRTLAGISLSGLFATWQWIESPFFNNVISISGSFWYDGFTAWLRSASIPPRGGKIYLSLGDEEEDTTVARFQPVKRCTDEVADILRRAGIDVVYKMTKGNHYAPPVPRLMSALDAIIG